MQLPKLGAEEDLSAISVVAMPHINDRDRRRSMKRLSRRTEYGPPIIKKMKVVEFNPKKAAQYFEERGSKTQDGKL